MSPGMEVGLSPGYFLLDGDPAPPPQKGGTPPIFGPCLIVYCGQTAGWIKMPLGVEVRFGPSHIVLDGEPASPKRGTFLLWLNGSRCHLVQMEASTQATLCYMGIQLLPIRGTCSLPIFGPCLLWPNGRPSQLLLSTCYVSRCVCELKQVTFKTFFLYFCHVSYVCNALNFCFNVFCVCGFSALTMVLLPCRMSDELCDVRRGRRRQRRDNLHILRGRSCRSPRHRHQLLRYV